MKSIQNCILVIILLSLVASCKSEVSPEDRLNKRYEAMLNYKPDSLGFPRSYSFKNKKIHKVPSKDWTSGFYPGNLWYIYELTGVKEYKNLAIKWTDFVEKEKYNDRTHDMGFKVYCSYGNGLKNVANEYYKDVILKSAQTLITRYDENVGAIRSWDFNKERWDFPVIIDNMMNLELLFEATKFSSDSTFHNIAVEHANTTLKNHFRDDNSCFHVLDYSPENGEIRMKVTHQGFADGSSWARGQGWAIYGFTMAYRYTKDERYLNQAKATATFYLDHMNLPEDGIPYWDFDAPNIPNEPRDVSAGALVASAFIELYGYTDDLRYLNYSKKVVVNLQTDEYLIAEDIDIPFVLKHSTGNWPKNDEIDEPIVYGDYYFLEAMLRLRSF